MKPQWDDLPSNVRGTVEQQIGQVLKVEPVTKGLMPGLAARLHTEDGGTVFLKAVSTVSPAASLYERERRVGTVLPPGLPAPRLRWSGEVEGWIVLLHEYVDGRDADLSPGSPDVPLVLDTLVVLNEALLARVPAWWSAPADAVTGLAALWTLFRLCKARFGPVEGRDFRARHAELLDWARSHGRLYRAGVLHILAWLA
ncbi:hypothetical protein [Streptosporangium sp. CA-115845]|uniref:hypothetical protein n=1 Tax=Streptosporangium sp. CA-115845 TaxID=3240071 RepID=UPI003D8B39B8